MKLMEEWIYQAITTGFVVIFCSLFKEELFQTKKFVVFFYILAIDKIMVKMLRAIKGGKRSKDKRQTRKVKGEK